MAEAFAADNKLAQAWQVLNRVRLIETTSLEFLETRQRIAEQAGYTADAYISAAERSLRMGEYRHAQAALDQASRLPVRPPQRWRVCKQWQRIFAVQKHKLNS